MVVDKILSTLLLIYHR